MAADPSLYMNSKPLVATMLPNGDAKFDCGFVIPTKEIQYIAGVNDLRIGDTISFNIFNVVVSRHIHNFRCLCGVARSE